MLSRRTLLAALVATAAVPPARAQQVRPLRLALLPDENVATIVQEAEPLAAYLTGRLGREVEIAVTTDYSSMIESMRFGRIDIGYFGPLSYVLAKSRAPDILPFAIGIVDGSPTYRAILVASADGPVRTLGDVAGGAFAFGDQASTSAHLAPRTVLAEAGLIAGEEYEAVYLGQHDAVGRAVAAGQVPAGGLSEEIYDLLVAEGRIDPTELRVLGYSAPLPNYPLTLQGSLDPALQERIVAAFLELDDPKILDLLRVERLAPAEDADYDVLREMTRVLGLDLAAGP